MIEAAKEILEMVKHMPEYTLWVLAGILFYKVFIIGSWIAVARLLILKAHDIIKNPKSKVIEHKLNGNPINESVVAGINSALSSVRCRNDNKGIYTSHYFHDSDVVWLQSAIDEKIKREKELKK